jgi:hypothetical protein
LILLYQNSILKQEQGVFICPVLPVAQKIYYKDTRENILEIIVDHAIGGSLGSLKAGKILSGL